MKGKISWLTTERGFGFIIGEDRTTRFFHARKVVPLGSFSKLDVGQDVEFDTEKVDNGPQNGERAVNVKASDTK